MKKISKLEFFRFEKLKEMAEEHIHSLRSNLQKFALLRECDVNLKWIDEQKQACHRYKLQYDDDVTFAVADDVVSKKSSCDAVGLEEVEKLKRHLDDFQRVGDDVIFWC